MKKSDIERLKKISEYCSKISKLLNDVNYQEFQSNYEKHDLCSFYLFQIGEMAHKLSRELKEKYPDHNWKGSYSLRNFIGHEYEDVNLDRVYRVATKTMPKLKEYVSNILGETFIENKSFSKNDDKDRNKDNKPPTIAHMLKDTTETDLIIEKPNQQR